MFILMINVHLYCTAINDLLLLAGTHCGFSVLDQAGVQLSGVIVRGGRPVKCEILLPT